MSPTLADFLGYIVNPPPGDPSLTAMGDQMLAPLSGAVVAPSNDPTGISDTQQINAAAARVSRGGSIGLVWLEQGVYTLNHATNQAGLNLPSNVWIIGCGRGVTILRLAATAPATGFPILCTNTTNVRLIALELDGNHAVNNASTSGVTFSATNASGVTKCRVDDCYVHGWGTDAVTGIGTSGQTFPLEVSATRSEFSNNGSGGLGRGFYVSNATAGSVTDCDANNNVQPGIEFDVFSSNFQVIGNRCSGNGNAGITAGKACSDYVIAKNICKNNGFWGITAASVQSKRFVIEGNVCNGNVGGITVDPKNNPGTLNTTIVAGDTTIIANLMTNLPPLVGADGLGWLKIDSEYISYTGVTNTTVTTFTGCARGQLGTAAAGHTAGATINDETVNECWASVTGNTCNNNSLHGINLNYARGVTITGNTCNNNNPGSGIQAAAAQDCAIEGNTCRFNSSRGLSLFNSSFGQWGSNLAVGANVLTNNTVGPYTNAVSGTVYGAIAGASTTTAPGAGGAGALPATPKGYLSVFVNGAAQQIPYY